MYITDRTLLLYKNFLRSNAYIEKKNHFVWSNDITMLLVWHQTTREFFLYDKARKVYIFILRFSLNHITHQRPFIHGTPEISYSSTVRRFKKKVILMIFRTSKQLFCENRNHLGETDFTIV